MSDKVIQWLHQLELSQYADTFSENAIEWTQLQELSNEDLKELGIAALGHRKRLLKAAQTLTEESAQQSLSSNQAQKIVSGRAERRQLTVMFCDLVGSTELSEKLDPEDLQEISIAYQNMCTSCIERFDGFVARYMGDGILAYFGYPLAHEDDAERAINASLDLVTGIASLHLPLEISLQVRVGIATGSVVVGDIIGKGVSREISVTGTTPNLAARLQGCAEPNAIIVSPATYQLTSGLYSFNDLGSKSLKGIEQPVNLWQIVANKATESRFGARQTQSLSALVGRHEESVLLVNRWDGAKNGEGHVVLVTGEPGIGKSRLCESIVPIVKQSPHHLCRLQCSSHHSSSALHPVITHLKNAAGTTKSNSQEENQANLTNHLQGFDHQLVENTALISSLLFGESGRLRDAELDQSVQKEKTLRALVRYYTDLSLQQPLLIIVEDLHWIDPSTQEFLELLIEEVQDNPLLLLATFRQTYKPEWIGQANISLITLNRLSKSESLELLSAVAISNQLSQEITADIIQKTDGIPLYIEEVTRTVLEDTQSDNISSVDSKIIKVPATLQDSLTARLDRLGTAKRIAQAGAAIGREFTEELILKVSSSSSQEVSVALKKLLDSGLLTRRGSSLSTVYTFKHALLQDAAYNSLLTSQRTNIHQSIAKSLTLISPEDFSLLAYHWELANELDKALTNWLLGANRSHKLYNRSEAIDQYWRALDLIDPPPETEQARAHHSSILLSALDVWILWRNDSEKQKAMRHIDFAIQYALKNGDFTSAASLAGTKGFHTDSETLIKQALVYAWQSKDSAVTASVSEMYSDFLGRLGRYDDSRIHASRAIKLYGELGNSVKQALTLVIQGRCYSARAGELTEALKYAARARRIANSEDDALLKACLVMECEPFVYQGLWEKTVQIAQQDLPLALEIDNWTQVLFSAAWAAIASIKLGHIDEAQRYIDEARDCTINRPNLEYSRSYFQTAVSMVHLHRGQLSDALLAAREAVELATTNNYALELGAGTRTLGCVLEALGDRQEAEYTFQSSVEILNNIQSKPEQAQTLLAYGQFMLEDNPQNAKRTLEQALALFTEINAVGWIKETQQAIQTIVQCTSAS